MAQRKNKKNFLAGAFATVSAVSIMIGSTALGAAVERTPVNGNASYQKAEDWNPEGTVGEGDAIKGFIDNGEINADDDTGVTFNRNDKVKNIINAQGENTFAGIVGTARDVIIKIGANLSKEDINVRLGTNDSSNYFDSTAVNDFSGLYSIDFGGISTFVRIDADNFNAPIQYLNGATGNSIIINAKTGALILTLSAI